jgi:uncharacterized membrane protein
MTDFTMYAGDSKTLAVTVRDADNVVVDLSGYTITWALSASVYDAEPLVSKTIGSGITVVDAAAGRFNVTIDPDDTADLRGAYYFEAEIVLSGSVTTVLTGTATIVASLI